MRLSKNSPMSFASLLEIDSPALLMILLTSVSLTTLSARARRIALSVGLSLLTAMMESPRGVLELSRTPTFWRDSAGSGHKPMLHRVERGGGTRRHADLWKQILQMISRGFRRDPETGRDLFVREP